MPRLYRDLVTVSRQEMGRVADDPHVHAAVPKLNGSVALCGAGKIVQKIPGWFDSSDPAACPACAQGLDDIA